MRKQSSMAAVVTTDEELRILGAARGVARTPTGGWLRAGRQARGVSQQQLATKLGFKRQAWAQLETSEAREAISLYSLRRAADALGYDLVYFLVPRGATGTNAPAVAAAMLGGVERVEAALSPAAAGVPATFNGSSDEELPTELR